MAKQDRPLCGTNAPPQASKNQPSGDAIASRIDAMVRDVAERKRHKEAVAQEWADRKKLKVRLYAAQRRAARDIVSWAKAAASQGSTAEAPKRLFIPADQLVKHFRQALRDDGWEEVAAEVLKAGPAPGGWSPDLQLLLEAIAYHQVGVKAVHQCLVIAWDLFEKNVRRIQRCGLIPFCLAIYRARFDSPLLPAATPLARPMAPIAFTLPVTTPETRVSPPRTPASPPVVPEPITIVDDRDIAILRLLNESQVLLKQAEIEGFNTGSRKTIGPRLAKLEGLGFISRPNGNRSGCTITSQGKVELARTR